MYGNKSTLGVSSGHTPNVKNKIGKDRYSLLGVFNLCFSTMTLTYRALLETPESLITIISQIIPQKTPLAASKLALFSRENHV